MTDQITQQPTPPVPPVPEAQPDNPPAEAQNTETQGQMIPYTRFTEVNEKRKQAETELERYRQAEREREQQEAIQRGEFEKVIADLEPKAKRADELEKMLAAYLQEEVKGIPEAWRDMIPEGDVTTQLAWIKQAKAKGLFNRPQAPNTDAGATGDPKQATKLSDQEQVVARKLGLTFEQYAKSKRT